MGCSFYKDLAFYDLTLLKILGPRVITQTDPTTGGELSLSFCQMLPEGDYCDANEATMAKLTFPNNVCLKLSGSSVTNDADLDVIEATNTTGQGVRMNFKNGDPTVKLTVEIMCTTDDYKLNDHTITSVDNVTYINVNFSSRVGCAYDQLSVIWKWFGNNKWIMFAVFFVLGMSLCFAGRAFIKATLCLLGVLISAFVIIFIFYSTFLKKDTELWIVWLVLGGAVLVGLLLGFIL